MQSCSRRSAEGAPALSSTICMTPACGGQTQSVYDRERWKRKSLQIISDSVCVSNIVFTRCKRTADCYYCCFVIEVANCRGSPEEKNVLNAWSTALFGGCPVNIWFLMNLNFMCHIHNVQAIKKNNICSYPPCYLLLIEGIWRSPLLVGAEMLIGSSLYFIVQHIIESHSSLFFRCFIFNKLVYLTNLNLISSTSIHPIIFRDMLNGWIVSTSLTGMVHMVSIWDIFERVGCLHC